MAQETIDSDLLNQLVSAHQNLAQAVETFIANNPAIPAAATQPLQDALSAGQKAQTDLANAQGGGGTTPTGP